jgi:choline dehydrogenase-like flavoprotein
MVDPNRRLSADRAALIEEFQKRPDGDAFIAKIRELRRDLPQSLPLRKLPFGSPHVYLGTDMFLPLSVRNATIFQSLACGGLSTVWGATVIPMTAHSFRNWPITYEEMAPFYRYVTKIMDVPKIHDDLECMYANFGNSPPPALSEQGTQLMCQLLNHRSRLSHAGIRFGRGRSAMGSRYSVDGRGCRACGLCMYGCPYHAIFNAEFVVDRLKVQRGFTHKAGFIAEAIIEQVDRVVVRLLNLDGGNHEEVACDRVFVACGAITSLRLVAGAMKWFGRPFHLKDTQQVSVPVFLTQPCVAGRIPKAFALSQVFLEVGRPEICDENIHLQVYGFNPFMVDILRARWGYIVNPRILQPLFDRMMIVMGYLPAQLSGSIQIFVHPSKSDGLPIASCAGLSNPRTETAVRAIAKLLLTHARDFGWLPTLPFVEVPEPGMSAHLAGCLPMKGAPSIGETDKLGRPCGLRRVHVVDAACFPDLPSEHLTYTIMANAARIARQASVAGAP